MTTIQDKTSEKEMRIETHILRGSAATYYIKQLAQHLVREIMETTNLPILANEIEVR